MKLSEENQEWLNCACIDTYESETERFVYERPMTERKLLEMQATIDAQQERISELESKLEPNMFWNKENPESSFETVEELFDYYIDHHENEEFTVECMVSTSLPNKTYKGIYNKSDCEWVVTELNKESK